MTDLAPRLAIPLLALIFAAVFEYSIAGLRFESRALPQFLIVILAAASLYEIVREIIEWRLRHANSDEAGKAEIPTRSLLRAGAVILATGFYVFALPRIGFYASAAAYIAVVYSAFGAVSWRIIPFVAGIIGMFYVLFNLILTVQLPGSF